MEIIYAILLLVVAVFSIINIISYISDRSSLKQLHKHIVTDLKVIRNLSSYERDAFYQLYKKKLPGTVPVYAVTGHIEYIGIKVNYNTSKDYIIGGVFIANKSVNKLARKDIGINLEYEAELIDRVDFVNEDNINKYMHTVEVVFLPQDIEKKQAYIIKYDNWTIESLELRSPVKHSLTI